MKWIHNQWLAAAMLSLAVGCAPQDAGQAAREAETTADEGMSDMAATESAMDEMEAAFIAAYDAGDAGALAALWAPDGTQAPPLSETLDRAGIEANYTAQFADGVPMALEVMREGMVVSGGMVAAWGGFVVTMSPPDGEPIVSNGRYGIVCRQEPDGTWKIFRQMFNYEVPPPGFGNF